MTTTPELLELTIAALKGATDAGDQVFGPRGWPTRSGEYPVILVQVMSERKEAIGNGTIAFEVTTSIRALCRTTAVAQSDDLATSIAEDQALLIGRQMERAVINNPLIMADPDGGNRLENYPSVTTAIQVNTGGRQTLVDIGVAFEMKFYQGPEYFFDPDLPTLDTIATFTAKADFQNPDRPPAAPGFLVQLPE